MLLSPTQDDLAAATELLREGGDLRASFCRAAERLLLADTATLWERFGDELHLTASGRARPDIELRLPMGPGSAAGHDRALRR